MDGTGDHNVDQDKPCSKNILHVFAHIGIQINKNINKIIIMGHENKRGTV
jgi:hypothetical protein